MDEKTNNVVEEYSAKILGKMVDLTKISEILKDENSTESQKIKAISKYFSVTDDDFSWNYHRFMEALGNEI